MADPHSSTPFQSNLYKDFFDDPTLSDLIIRLSDRSVHVHRIVLCRRSVYFTKLLTGSFKESGSKEIQLKDDDPAAMVALLHYIYDLPFDEHLGDQCKSLVPYIQIYIAADKYQVHSLKLAVSNKIKQIVGIKMNFDKKASKPSIEDFLAALKVIITSSTPQDMLRKVMVEACVMNLRRLHQRPELLSLIGESSELGAAIIGHKNLECGLPGSWSCRPSCENKASMRCSRCKSIFKTEYAWNNRDESHWLCPQCSLKAEPRCASCGHVIKWARRGLL